MGKHDKKVMDNTVIENAQDVTYEAVPDEGVPQEEPKKVSFLGKAFGKTKDFVVGVGRGVKKHGKKIVAGTLLVGGAIATGVVLTALHGKDAESYAEAELNEEAETCDDYPPEDDSEETVEEEPYYDFAVKVVNWPESGEDSNESAETEEVEET